MNAVPRMRSCPKASVYLALGSLAKELIKPPLELRICPPDLVYHLLGPVKVLPVDQYKLRVLRCDAPQEHEGRHPLACFRRARLILSSPIPPLPPPVHPTGATSRSACP